MTEQRGDLRWRGVNALGRLVRRLPPAARQAVGRLLLGVFRFGTTPYHYAARHVAVAGLSSGGAQYSIIGPGVYLISPERMQIGDRVSINHLTYIDASGGLRIGTGTRIGNHVTIVTGNHNMVEGRIDRRAVEIGTGAWIGAGARILAGVRIGDRAVIGAGAVVTRDVAAGEIVGGVPARPLFNKS